MKKFYEFLRRQAVEINEDEVMKSLTNEQQKSYENEKICYICKGKFEYEHAKDKIYRKVRDFDHYIDKYRGAAHLEVKE